MLHCSIADGLQEVRTLDSSIIGGCDLQVAQMLIAAVLPKYLIATINSSSVMPLAAAFSFVCNQGSDTSTRHASIVAAKASFHEDSESGVTIPRKQLAVTL